MIKRVHFLGIGGSGASAAASLAQTQGFEVTGCDLETNNEFTTQFESSQLFKGHSPDHLEGVEILALTPAIFSLDANNPELLEAKKRNIPVMTWQQFTGEYLTKDKFVIAVCGTHGKTTTTAMIAKLLEDAQLDPTVELGAIVPQWKTNYRVGRGKLVLSEQSESNGYFVIEADEFNDNFLYLKPDITVVTNIEMDHPEYFKDFEAVKDSFTEFLSQTKGVVVANLSDLGIAEVVKVAMKTPIKQMTHDRGTNVQYLDYSKNEFNVSLKIPGEFNKLNAAAAFQVGLLLNIDPSIIRKSLESYPGVSRRFEYIGEFKEAKVYSDFGHHPTEIKVTAKAVREKFPNSKIILVYQPHMFSRTKALFEDFVKVFKEVPVNKVFIMDIYPSREVDTGLVSAEELVNAINKTSVTYIGKAKQTLEKLKPEIKEGDIVFFMSAGDTDILAKELVKG